MAQTQAEPIQDQAPPDLSGPRAYCRKRFRALFWGLMVVSFLVSGWGVQTDWFHDLDEPRYVETAFEMYATGDLARPMLDGVPRMEKPPLAYWAVVPFHYLAGSLFGDQAITISLSRVPAVLAAVLVVAATVLMGRRLFDELNGLLAGMAIQTSFLFHALAVTMKTDILLACFTAWACLFLLLRLGGDRRLRIVLGALVCTSLAVMAKAHIGYLPLAAYLAAAGLEEGRNASGWKDRLKGAWAGLWRERWLALGVGILALLPLAGWVAWVEWVRDTDYLSGMADQARLHVTMGEDRWLTKFSLGRADFFLDSLLVFFLPWGAYLPGAVAALFRKGERETRTAGYLRTGVFLLSFVILATLAYDLKSHRYVLPALPFAALLVAAWLVNGRRDRVGRILFEAGTWWIFGAVAFFGYRFFRTGFFPSNLDYLFPVEEPFAGLWIFGGTAALFLAGTAWVSVGQAAKPLRHVLVLAGLFVPMVLAHPLVLPQYDSLDNHRPMPLAAPALNDLVAPCFGPDTLVLHSEHFRKRFPDFLFQKKELDPQGGLFYTLPLEYDPVLFLRSALDPLAAMKAVEALDLQTRLLPVYQALGDRRWKRTVVLLADEENGEEFPAFRRAVSAMGAGGSVEITAMDVLTAKMMPARVHVVVAKGAP